MSASAWLLFPHLLGPLLAIVPHGVVLAGVRLRHDAVAHAHQALPHHGMDHRQVKVDDEHGKGDDEHQVVDEHRQLEQDTVA